MKCLRCGSQNYFHEDCFGTYCRRCVVFGRLNIHEKQHPVKLSKPQKKVSIHLTYALTTAQKQASQLLLDYIEKSAVIIHAVCGAGKTEILIPLLEKYFNLGYTICISIPRRQVALELYQRLKEIICDIDIVVVCKDYTRKTKAPFVICTTHQLYRYYKAFDILIIDEVDAFPYENDVVLHKIAHQSYKKHIVYMSATLSNSSLKWIKKNNIQLITLNQRYHERKLPIPKIYTLPFFMQFVFLLYYIHKFSHLTKLIFLPTIKQCESLYRILKRKYPVFLLTSQSSNKSEILQDLMQQSQRILITTTIMERGITIEDASVIVMNAQHHVFSEASLIQIAGRVDRKIKSYNAPIYFLSTYKTPKLSNIVKQLKEKNHE